MAIHSASLSDPGRRKNNEDFAAHFEPEDPLELQKSGCLYIIADGVGGAAKGERASQFAAQKVLYEYYQPENIDLEPLERLRLILERASGDIYDYASQNNTRMATTIVAAVVRGGILYVANVGDSRAYLIRDGAAKSINRDHSIVGEMVEHGEMTEVEAMASRIKNRLTRSLGGDPKVSVGVYSPIPLKPGDKILLCSDGLTRYALQEDVTRMTAEGEPEDIAQRLVQFANRKGGADNISVIVISYQIAGTLEPTVIAARPKQVDWETLITQPETRVRKKRQPVRAIVMLIGVVSLFVVAGIVLKFTLPMFMGTTASDPNALPTTDPNALPTTDPNALPTTDPNALPITDPNALPTTDPNALPTIDPNSLPTTDPNATAAPLTAVLNNCGSPLVVHKEAGKTKDPFIKEDGNTALLRNGDRVVVVASGKGANVTEYSNPYNSEGIWLKIIYPPNTEKRNWISKENCVDVDLEALKKLKLIPLGE